MQLVTEETSGIHIACSTSLHTDDWGLGKDANRLMSLEAWIRKYDEGRVAIPMRTCHAFGVDIVQSKWTYKVYHALGGFH